MKKNSVMIIFFIFLCSGLFFCSKMVDKLRNANPEFVIENWLSAYKNQDWQKMYNYTHSDYIRFIRSKKLTLKQKKMNDKELFAMDMALTVKKYPKKKLETYEIKQVPEFRKGDKTVWITVDFNDLEIKIPVILEKMELKIDPNYIKIKN